MGQRDIQIIENPPQSGDGASVSAPDVVFGPTPDGLSELQGRWIDAMVQLGGRTGAAAEAAGYGRGAEGMGIRNLANPKLQGELVKRIKLQAGSALATAIGGLLRVIESSKDDKAVVQAAIAVAHMFGLAPQKAPLVAIQQNFNGAEHVSTILKDVAEARQRRLSARDDG